MKGDATTLDAPDRCDLDVAPPQQPGVQALGTKFRRTRYTLVRSAGTRVYPQIVVPSPEAVNAASRLQPRRLLPSHNRSPESRERPSSPS